jgi:hypothetical protein
VRQVAVEKGNHWQDKARIKLNHAVHLDPRGVLQLDRTRRRLECNACHAPDQASGYMQPINHEQHCAACHANQLLFDQTLFPEQRVPHGDASQVRGALREFFAQAVAKQGEDPAAARPAEPLLPTMSVSQQDDAWINERINNAQRVLFEQKGTGCNYCHPDVTHASGEWFVAPAAIPVRWLLQAHFRHDSHRMLTCVACHAKAPASRETSDVLLPGIESCRECHQQPSLLQLTTSSPARAECAKCHVYHQHHGENFDGPLGLDMEMLNPERVRQLPQESTHEGRSTGKR